MKNKKSKLILITGGHATPAIACIEELKSRGFTNLVYVGQRKSLLFDRNLSSEYRLITEKESIPFKNLIAGKLSLFFNLHSLIWLLRIPIGFIQALYFLLTLRPSIILTFGSHVAVPICFWGSILKIPIIAHEQTTTTGRSNKFIQNYADKVCLSWDENIDESSLNSDKFVLTGNPIRNSILKVTTDHFHFKDNRKKTIFITGGNQGAHAINEFIFSNIEKLTSKYNVIHQTGSNTLFNDFAKATQLEKKLNSSGTVYISRDYIFVEEMAEAYAKSDIVVSRAGANTITELLVLKKKAILIPIPTTSGDEQFKNAKLLEELGLGKTILQSELNFDNFEAAISYLLENNNMYLEKIDILSKRHMNAQKKIIDVLELVLK